ncbi:hypothetical protein D9758_011069 [Tetrapyrgos nigripes]|uniref:Thioredoxin domain-containing protein n=1 Tax=Tetrapyrgos nigripes TaxID=182062 RepID=A0A8H5FSJ8_9AGAR|nr:hypothetical protein D9758_011069 [Tetrapyrgos nigripes]
MADAVPKREYSLRLGSTAPDFEADTTIGRIKFHEWLGNSWGILFSHPGDFTPVCTTELGEVARRAKDWEARNVKVIGISANGLEEHAKWIEDINSFGGKTAGPTDVQFPISLTSMTCWTTRTSPTVTTKVFPSPSVPSSSSTPQRKIRLTLNYPAVAGRNFDEIIRAIDAIQLGDKHRIATPVNWNKGQDVIIHASVNNEEAKTLFPNHVAHLPYLRTTPLDS